MVRNIQYGFTLYILFSMHITYGTCNLGPNGINQWRLIFQIGECIEDSTNQILSSIDLVDSHLEVCCSTLETTILLAEDAILSAIDNISCTVSAAEELTSTIEACCSNLSTIITSVSDTILDELDACCSTNAQLALSLNDVLESDLAACCSTLETAINTTTNTVISTSDVLTSDIAACCSTLESKIDNISALDLCDQTEVLSELDILISKTILLESILDQLTNQATGFVSLFGDQVSSGRNEYINLNFQYGTSSYDTTTTTANGGSLLTTNSMITLSTGTNAAGTVSVQTNRRLNYRAGHEAYAFFSAIFPNGGAANSTQWIGLFDSVNGAAIGFNGTQFSILFRQNSIDTIIPQASFNQDPLDGTGPSGITLNPALFNVFRISYGWLGSTSIVFQITDATGKWHTFHIIERPNLFTTPSFFNPILPMRAEVINSGNTTDIRLGTASWNAGIIGDLSHVGQRIFATMNNTAKVVGTTEIPIISIRSNTTFNSIANAIEARLYAFGGGDFSTGISRIFLRLRKNATLTGAAFVDVSTGNSVMQVDTSAIAVSGGTFLLLSPDMSMGGGPMINYLSDYDVDIIILPGDTLTITAQASSGGGGSEVRGTFTWAELF